MTAHVEIVQGDMLELLPLWAVDGFCCDAVVPILTLVRRRCNHCVHDTQ